MYRPAGLPRRRSFGPSSNLPNEEEEGGGGGRNVFGAGARDEPLITSAWEAKGPPSCTTRHAGVITLLTGTSYKVIKKRRTPSKINTGSVPFCHGTLGNP